MPFYCKKCPRCASIDIAILAGKVKCNKCSYMLWEAGKQKKEDGPGVREFDWRKDIVN